MNESFAAHDAPAPMPRPRSAPAKGATLIIIAMVMYVITVGCFLLATTIARMPERSEGLGAAMAILLGIGLIALFFGTFTLIVGAIRWALYGPATPPALDNAIGHQHLMRTLQTISDRQLISDAAKRIAYREQDRNALRDAIREDIRKGDFEAALVLAKEMGETYGYREESEEFRDIILDARNSDTQQKVAQAIAGLDQLLADHQWHRALQEARKIQRLYPETPRVQGLENYVNHAFEQYKRDLERQFLEAAQRDDIELAMELLKELDKYLTEAQAAPLREIARGVIGKKRDNLGVQFKMAVQDHEWSTALRVGEQIVRDFPNSKMAAEVRGRIDHLRDLATREQAAAEGV